MENGKKILREIKNQVGWTFEITWNDEKAKHSIRKIVEAENYS